MPALQTFGCRIKDILSLSPEATVVVYRDVQNTTGVSGKASFYRKTMLARQTITVARHFAPNGSNSIYAKGFTSFWVYHFKRLLI